MAEITVKVCDICMDPGRPSEEWVLGTPGDAHLLVLCEEHATPMRDLIASVASAAPEVTPIAKKAAAKRATAKKAPSTPRRARKATSMMLTTPEEIERLKTTGKA